MLQIYRPAPPYQWSWIAIKGPDAADFLHRLTTVHVKAMNPGEGSPGFFLTAQGKMRAYFYIWMVSPEEFFFEVDPGISGRWKQELLKVIDQFHFGEKITVESGDASPLQMAWIFGQLDGPTPNHFVDQTGGARLLHHGDRDFGISWISA